MLEVAYLGVPVVATDVGGTRRGDRARRIRLAGRAALLACPWSRACGDSSRRRSSSSRWRVLAGNASSESSRLRREPKRRRRSTRNWREQRLEPTPQDQGQSAATAATPYLYWWLLVAIFFEYARPGAFLPGINSLRLNSLIPLALVVVCVFASNLRPRQEILQDSITKWIIAYFGLIALSLVHAEVTLYAFDGGQDGPWLPTARVRNRSHLHDADRIRGVFAVLVVAHLFLLAMNPAAVLNPHQRNYIIGGTFLGDGNDFALSVCILVPMAIELALSSTSKLRRVIWLSSLAVLVLTVIGTQSRGGTLGPCRGRRLPLVA